MDIQGTPQVLQLSPSRSPLTIRRFEHAELSCTCYDGCHQKAHINRLDEIILAASMPGVTLVIEISKG
jgi:hypothetical protein